MKKIWIFLARFFGYNQVIEDKTKGYIKFEIIAVEDKKDEIKISKQIIEELKLKVEDLKKDVKKTFDDIIKILDLIKKYEKQS